LEEEVTDGCVRGPGVALELFQRWVDITPLPCLETRETLRQVTNPIAGPFAGPAQHLGSDIDAVHWIARLTIHCSGRLISGSVVLAFRAIRRLVPGQCQIGNLVLPAQEPAHLSSSRSAGSSGDLALSLSRIVMHLRVCLQALGPFSPPI